MYDRFFNFRDQPFRLTPDPRYLFLGAKHREGYAHLLFAMREGSGFVAVTGEIGTGKTTLVRALLQETHDEELAVAYIFNPVLSPTELLQTINSEFGLPSRSSSKKELTEILNQFLVAQKVEGSRAVVIVDEAQNLEPAVLEQLRLLSNLETETEKLLQIILLGQPELRDVLDRPDLRQLSQRVALRWHLDPLERSEVHKYVRHRLRIAGANAGIFDAKALDLIADHSGGLPRLINILAHRALLVAFTQGVRAVGPAQVATAAVELGESRVPLRSRPRGWMYKAAAGAAVTAAAAAVAFLLVAPLRDDSTGASVVPRSQRAALPAQGSESTVLPEPQALRRVAAIEPQVLDVGRLDKRLSRADAYETAVAGMSRLVLLWTGRELSAHEIAGGQMDLEVLGARRGLSYLGAETTPGLLSLLDLPAIVEMQLLGVDELRFVLVETLGPDRVLLHLDREMVVSASAFAELWTGRAHLLWKDAEALRRSLGSGASGPAVTRLQQLLAELGLFSGQTTGVYDEATAAAVSTFQASYGLEPDGVAGTITQIVLYNALDRFERPRLAQANRAGLRPSGKPS